MHSETQKALLVAFRHFDDEDTTDLEREAILVSIIENLNGTEAETASRILHHMREARVLQLELSEMLVTKGGAS
jgi:hypothetical protein